MDMGLSIGFFALFALFGSLDYSVIFSVTPLMNETAITIIGILLLTGAMAKSAQIPLHSWLPGSMEGSIYFYFKLFLYLNLIFVYYNIIYNILYICSYIYYRLRVIIYLYIKNKIKLKILNFLIHFY